VLSLNYIAGFYDGEGSIGIYRNGCGTFYLRSQLTQNVGAAASGILTEVMGRWGGNISIQRTSHGEKFNWQLNSSKARVFLSHIEPFLILKKEQAEIARLWSDVRPVFERGARGQFLRLPRREIDHDVGRLMKALKHAPLETILRVQPDLGRTVETLRKAPGRIAALTLLDDLPQN
jgi:hypothetical protein